IKVPDGPLTSRLQHIQVGDTVMIGRKASGTLLTQNLLPGKNLYLLSTGTGLAPFMAMIRDPEVYELYEKVILVHGCRQVAELAYDEVITKELPNNEYFGEQVKQKLIYYPTVTREAFRNQGRIPTLLETGKLMHDVGLPPLSKEDDRFMLCGSPEMLRDTRTLFDKLGMTEGNMSTPGHFVIERAFVDK
ncbi:MAG: ferredoxin--NADP reductase, partial [Rhizobacter sp.]|nr:ferredoxin--NADP reductase [Rhizobacter sp.]